MSTPNDPPVEEVVQVGALPRLVQFLQDHANPSLQFEAAWALTNIGSSDLTYTIVEGENSSQDCLNLNANINHSWNNSSLGSSVEITSS